MATYGYTAPGVRVTEVSVPTVAPIFERPTNIALVGEALGYQEVKNEIVFLEDNDAVALRVPGANHNTVVVKDSYDTSTTYAPGSDYVLGYDGDYTTIRRNVYTTIESNEPLVMVLTTTGDNTKTREIGAEEDTFGVSGLSSTTVSAPTADDVEIVTIQRAGRFNTASDYDVSVSGTTTAQIRRKAGTPRIEDGQTVYVSYTTNNGANIYLDEAMVLSGTSYSSNFNAVAEGVDSDSIVVRNMQNMGYADQTAVVVFSEGATSDYTITFDNGATPNPTITIARSMGPSAIGAAENRRTVKVTYQATTPDYYLPIRCFSYSQVESRFGAAIDPINGTILSPLSFGAYMAFVNGASDIVCQALYHTGDASDSQALRTAPSSSVTDPTAHVADWQSAFRSLRDFPEINVVVPIIGQTATLTDNHVKSVFQSLQDHINYQSDNDEHIVCILGEDSTVTAGRANLATLQSHALSLGSHVMASRTALISPGGFAFPNGNLPRGYMPIGGQYVAAALAGQLAQRPVQDALTRKSIVGVTDVLDYRSKEDKNNDAQSGLMVIERRNNAVTVRHAVTTAITDVNGQELSVVRAKLYMMESLRRTLDIRIIGQIPADDVAPTVVGATVQGVLETLVQGGAIVAYSALQVRSLGPSQPSTIEVRFNYKPSYPLNYINVVFSVDINTGSTTTGV